MNTTTLVRVIDSYGSEVLCSKEAIEYYRQKAISELEQLKSRLAEAEGALELIGDIAYDRDGYTSVDKLGELIDELYKYAKNPKMAYLVNHPEEEEE